MASIHCKNCDHHYKGNFCPHCGQKATVEKITFSYLLHDIPHSVFHVDKGFLYTLKWMFTNPGKAIKEYLAGKRVQHFRPFAYVIILSTICTLLTPLVEKATISLFIAKNPGYTITYRTLFFEKYISLFIFMLIPALSLVTWITFKKKPYKYWEHFLGNTYLAAQLNIFLLAIDFFGFLKVVLGFSPNTSFTGFMFLYMFYYSYCFKVWMAPHKNRWSLLFSLLIMNFFLATIYMTGLSLTGLMTPWWNF
jgi:Protein of unknown function (DUF3667)